MPYNQTIPKAKEQKKSYSYLQKPEIYYNPDTSENTYSFIDKHDKSYSIEVSNFYDEEDNAVVWYVYHAKDGKGIEDTPDIFSNEYDALKQAKLYAKQNI